MNVPVNKTAFLRLTIIVLGSLFAMQWIPVQGSAFAPRYDIAAAMLTGSLLSFLIYQAAERRRLFLSTFYFELNKLRRIYHISKNIAETNQRFRAWFTDLHGYLVEYMSFFKDKGMEDYSDSNPYFRKVSYNIYKIPDLETKREEALFTELLHTSGVVAQTRSKIKEIYRSRLSAYSWLTVLLMTAGFITTVVYSTADTSASRLVGGITIGIVLLMVDLLWEVDSLAAENSDFAQRYVMNVGKLQLRRDDRDE